MKSGIFPRFLIALTALLTLALVLVCACSQLDMAKADRLQEAVAVRVVDGDTIAVETAGTQAKVRLVNVDAPESVNPDESRNTEAGERASRFTASLVKPGQMVYLQREVSDTDKYGRLLRHVWLEQPDDVEDAEEVETKMLDAILVKNGHAEVKDYPPDIHYSSMLREIEQKKD